MRICETEWPLRSVLSCLQLQAISVLPFPCVAVKKDLENIKLKNDRFSVAGSACLSIRRSELERH